MDEEEQKQAKSYSFRRLCGDTLEVTFAPDGSLSAAVLCVEGQNYCVTVYFKGLLEEQRVFFLGVFGFVEQLDPVAMELLPKVLSNLPDGCVVESIVEVRGGVFRLVAISEEERSCPTAAPVMRIYLDAEGRLLR